MKRILFVLVLLVSIISCASLEVKSRVELFREKTYAVVPFENYTDTPLAGFRIASLLEGLLRAEGFRVIRVWNYTYTEPDEKLLSGWRKEAEKKADFVIFGSVNEFRYKAGVEGEPAVSISLYVYDTSSGRTVGGASGSATGSGNESLGTLTQKLLKRLILK